jgi:hypothetical protein
VCVCPCVCVVPRSFCIPPTTSEIWAYNVLLFKNLFIVLSCTLLKAFRFCSYLYCVPHLYYCHMDVARITENLLLPLFSISFVCCVV